MAELQQQALEAQRRLQEAQDAENRFAQQQGGTQIAPGVSDEVEGEAGDGVKTNETVAIASAAVQPLEIPQPKLTVEQLAALRDTSLRDLQTLLRDRNCYFSGIDGVYGPGTSRGVETIAKLVGVGQPLDKDSETADILQFIEEVRSVPSAVCPAAKVRKSKQRRASTSARSQTSSTKTRSQGQDYRNNQGDFCDWFLRGNVCDSPG